MQLIQATNIIVLLQKGVLKNTALLAPFKKWNEFCTIVSYFLRHMKRICIYINKLHDFLTIVMNSFVFSVISPQNIHHSLGDGGSFCISLCSSGRCGCLVPHDLTRAAYRLRQGGHENSCTAVSTPQKNDLVLNSLSLTVSSLVSVFFINLAAASTIIL